MWYGNAYGTILQSMIDIHGENVVTSTSKEEGNTPTAVLVTSKDQTFKIQTDTGDLLDIIDVQDTGIVNTVDSL